MKCSDIMKQLEKLAPQELACEWDNVGLLLGRTDKNISKILIALELSEEVVDQAISSRADMIITHHPLIFKPLPATCNFPPPSKERVILLSEKLSTLSTPLTAMDFFCSIVT